MRHPRYVMSSSDLNHVQTPDELYVLLDENARIAADRYRSAARNRFASGNAGERKFSRAAY